ncbi:phage adaptor protein [Klebsiella variicola]|uniref:phage adaptor protein n=1 Tax=Klebsiella variicola TaxID=244366 RepID=UPI003D004177
MATSNYPISTPPYPISNYGDLKSLVQLWCDRDDDVFCEQIPNFVDFAQKEIYRVLRITPMAKEAYLEIDNGAAYIPSDFLEADYLRFVDNNLLFRETTIEEVTAKNNTDLFASQGVDANYCRENGIEPLFARMQYRWIFYPAITAPLPEVDPNSGANIVSGQEVVLGYYGDPVMMKDDSDTNPLITLASEALLYLTMSHACVFTQDNDKASFFEQQANKYINQLQEQEAHTEFRSGPIRVVAANVHSYWG